MIFTNTKALVETNPTTPGITEPARIDRWIPADDQPICPSLPLLDYLYLHLGGLSRTTRGFLGLQHLFGSTASLIDKLTRGSVAPDRVFLLGKPYSANPQVTHFLSATQGYWVHPYSMDQPVDRPNDGEMDRRIKHTLQACRSWLIDRDWRRDGVEGANGDMVLIDDGGRAIRMLHTPEFADIRKRFTCVEQTRAGIRELEDIQLEIPVVNVAQSWVKLEHESPLIAQSVNRELSKQLTIMEKAGIETGRRALIIGYGSIGRAVAAELHRQGRAVAVYDPDEKRGQLAIRDGFRTINDIHTALAEGGLIVGCTGIGILDEDDYEFIPHGSVLVSTSSSDIEFRGWKLRTRAISMGRPESWRARGEQRGDELYSDPGSNNDHPCFSLYRVQSNNRSFYLVNGGFPVNFNGGIDPIPAEIIQLTRGLLFCGAWQASRTSTPGLHALDDMLQKMTLRAYDRLTRLRAAGGVLCS